MGTVLIVAAIVAGFAILGAVVFWVASASASDEPAGAPLIDEAPAIVDAPVAAELTAEVPATKRAKEHHEFVITSIGEPEAAVPGRERKEFKPGFSMDRLARTALIEVASVLHGLREAVTEENRARIAYEMKLELIRVRKARKAEIREALRDYRARHRAPLTADQTPREGTAHIAEIEEKRP